MSYHRNSYALSSAARRLCVTVFTVFAVVLLVGALPASVKAASSATVGGDEQAREAAASLSSLGILTGWGANQGIPQEYVTRGQFAIMLARALGLKASSTEYFSDVPNSLVCSGAVGALHEAGLTVGSSGTTFAPDELITRQEAARWLMDSLSWGVSNGKTTFVSFRLSYYDSADGWLGGFRDRTLISSEYHRAVANAYRLGIVGTSEEGWFYPTLPLSWGDAIIWVERALVRRPQARTEYPVPLDARWSYPESGPDAEGPLVWYIQYRLAELKYVPGEIDGVYASHTRDAVLAFQKVEGLRRTGVVSDSTWSRLFIAQTPTPVKTGEGTRVEIDLTRQVLFMITDNNVWKIVHVSTGSSGRNTRTGHFSIRAKYEGNVECVTVTGTMYYPSYVVSRTAIHGYPYVPAYPASHGCIRVPMWMARQLWYETPMGMVVDIFYSR